MLNSWRGPGPGPRHIGREALKAPANADACGNRRGIMRRGHFSAVVMVTMLTASACSGTQPGGEGPGPATSQPVEAGPSTPTAASSRWPDRLPPGGSFADSSGLVTFVDGDAWLPVGSDLARVDGDGKPLLKSHLMRVDVATGKFTARVRLSSNASTGAGEPSFAMGDSVVVRTEDGAEVISTQTLRRKRKLPGGKAYAFGSIWDIREGPSDGQVLIRIDPTSGKITGRLPTLGKGGYYDAASDFTVGAGAVWVGMPDQTVVRVDPKTMRPIATIQLDKAGATYSKPDVAMGFGYGAVWANQMFNGPGKLYRIDPATNQITNSASLGDPTAGAAGVDSNLAFGKNSVWTCDSSNKLTQVDATTGEVQSVRSQPLDLCERVSVGGGSIWLSNDARSEQPTTVRIQL